MTPYPIVQRYNYPKFNATTFPTGGRVYHTPGGDLPSVTTILSIVPKPGLDEWRRRKGEEEANKIVDEACRIGTTMHDRLEGYVSNYLKGRPNIPPETEEDQLAYKMADNIKCYALADLDQVWGIEEALYCDSLYAGRADLIGLYNGKSAIIDYKSAKRWKKPEWIESYKMQIAAYNFCHKSMFGEGMETGVILMAVRPPCKQTIQRVVLNKTELNYWEEKWFEVVGQYYTSHK